MEFRGIATNNPLFNSHPMSRLAVYEDRIEIRMLFGRQRIIPRDSVWKVSLEKLIFPPFLYRPYFDFRWFESGKLQRLYFIKGFTKKLYQELSDKGWPIE